MMRDLTVEQYHMLYPEQNGSVLTQPGREVSSKVSWNHQGGGMAYPMTIHLYIFAYRAFANSHYFIFFIFLACWYLKLLLDLIKDKICLYNT